MNLMEDERLQRFFEIIRGAAVTGEEAEERKLAEIVHQMGKQWARIQNMRAKKCFRLVWPLLQNL